MKRRTRLLGLAMGFGIAVLVIVGLQVNQRFQEFRSASTDNMQWNFAQLEVEYLRFQSAANGLSNAAEPDYANFRRRFDLFYSRVATTTVEGPLAELATAAEVSAQLTGLREWVEELVPLVDGPDDQLNDGIGKLNTELVTRASEIRKISLDAVGLFAQISDEQRREFSRFLTIFAALALAMLITALTAFLLLLKTYRNSVRREEQLGQTTLQLQSTVGASLDAVLVIDRDNNVIDFNGAAEDIFGYSRDQVLGQDMTQMIMPEKYRDMHKAGMARFLETGEKRVVDGGLVQLEAMRADGTVFPVELSIASAKNDYGPVFVSFIRDISERVKAENALIQARDDALAADKAKGEFIAVMSHEMRNPLNGLMASLELMSEDDLTSKQERNLGIAQRTSAQILDHVSDVLDISAIESGTFQLRDETFSPSELTEEIVQTHAASASAKGNKISTALSAALPDLIFADRGRINQILLNLVGNANKFTSDGTIHLTCDLTKLDSGLDALKFAVSDTGIGIPEDKLDTIFEDFVSLDRSLSRSQGGTGLGLGISKRIVTQLGGQIGVKSQPDEGSEFWFEIPVELASTDIETDPDVRPRQATTPDPADLRILLAEDDALNRSVMTDYFASLGATADHAINGEEAVNMAQEKQYDLILMDVSMPTMDGMEATRLIRSKHGPSTRSKIIALTAYTSEDARNECLAAGMDDVFHKPIKRSGLSSILASVEHTESGPPESAQETTEIDTQVVEDLLEVIGKEKFEQNVDLFFNEFDAQTASLGNENPDRDAVVKNVHRLAGSAGMIGCSGLQTALVTLETELAQNSVDLPSISDRWKEIQAVARRCRAQLAQT